MQLNPSKLNYSPTNIKIPPNNLTYPQATFYIVHNLKLNVLAIDMKQQQT